MAFSNARYGTTNRNRIFNKKLDYVITDLNQVKEVNVNLTAEVRDKISSIEAYINQINVCREEMEKTMTNNLVLNNKYDAILRIITNQNSKLDDQLHQAAIKESFAKIHQRLDALESNDYHVIKDELDQLQVQFDYAKEAHQEEMGQLHVQYDEERKAHQDELDQLHVQFDEAKKTHQEKMNATFKTEQKKQQGTFNHLQNTIENLKTDQLKKQVEINNLKAELNKKRERQQVEIKTPGTVSSSAKDSAYTPGTIFGSAKDRAKTPGAVSGSAKDGRNTLGSVSGSAKNGRNTPGSISGSTKDDRNTPGSVSGKAKDSRNTPGSVSGSAKDGRNTSGAAAGGAKVGRTKTSGAIPDSAKACAKTHGAIVDNVSGAAAAGAMAGRKTSDTVTGAEAGVVKAAHKWTFTRKADEMVGQCVPEWNWYGPVSLLKGKYEWRSREDWEKKEDRIWSEMMEGKKGYICSSPVVLPSEFGGGIGSFGIKSGKYKTIQIYFFLFKCSYNSTVGLKLPFNLKGKCEISTEDEKRDCHIFQVQEKYFGSSSSDSIPINKKEWNQKRRPKIIISLI